MNSEYPQAGTSGTIIATAPIRASGLRAAKLFELVEIAEGVPALVVGLLKDAVELAPLVNLPIEVGTPVRLRGPVRINADLPRGEVNSILDLLDKPGDKSLPLIGAIESARWTVNAPRRRFETGLLVYDIMGRLQHGDAILLCQNGVSRTVYLRILRKLLIEQERNGARCIYVTLRPAACAVSARELLDRVAENDSRHSWSQTLFLELSHDAAPAQTLLLLRAAAALAQSWSDTGEDVTVVVDELSLLRRLDLGVIPGYSSVSELGALTSIARRSVSGSVTIVLGSAARPDSSTAQFFDHTVDLSRAVSGSVDHRGSKLAKPPLRVEPMGAVGAIVSASALADDVAGRAEMDERTSAQLCGQGIQQVLGFKIAGSLTLAEQLLCVLAVAQRTDIDPARVERFAHGFIGALRQELPDYLEDLRNGAAIRCDDHQPWLTIADRVAKTFLEKT